jgi:hypothetical protein
MDATARPSPERRLYMARSLRSIGMILLAVWLILHGLVTLASLHFAGLQIILGVLALVAGVLILLGK